MRPRKQPDAIGVVDAAEATLERARQHDRDLRHQQIELDATIAQAGKDVRDRLFAAGRAGEEPQGLDELRQRLADLQQRRDALLVQREGAEHAVREATAALGAARRDAYPQLAERLDKAAEELLLDRARLDAAEATWQGRLAEHRTTWATLLDAYEEGFQAAHQPHDAAGALLLGDDLSPRQRPDRSKYGPGMAGAPDATASVVAA